MRHLSLLREAFTLVQPMNSELCSIRRCFYFAALFGRSSPHCTHFCASSIWTFGMENSSTCKPKPPSKRFLSVRLGPFILTKRTFPILAQRKTTVNSNLNVSKQIRKEVAGRANLPLRKTKRKVFQRTSLINLKQTGIIQS